MIKQNSISIPVASDIFREHSNKPYAHILMRYALKGFNDCLLSMMMINNEVVLPINDRMRNKTRIPVLNNTTVLSATAFCKPLFTPAIESKSQMLTQIII